ncbi:hypothetical protein SH449x_001106 [Pirellulaceae bacterium SH449]
MSSGHRIGLFHPRAWSAQMEADKISWRRTFQSTDGLNRASGLCLSIISELPPDRVFLNEVALVPKTVRGQLMQYELPDSLASRNALHLSWFASDGASDSEACWSKVRDVYLEIEE